MRGRRTALFLTLVALWGCSSGGSDDAAIPDASRDGAAPTDVAVDAAPDATADVAPMDVAADTAADVAADTAADVPLDAAADVASDAAADAAADVTPADAHVDAGSCIASFEAAVSPHLGDVLFLSESDREITTVSYPGAGANPPTAASVLALVGAPAGSTAELRSVDAFFGDLEPSSGTADPGAPAAIRAAYTAQLTGVIYVAVHAPPGSPDAAQVRVYLVGRTACGDVVGLASISVET